MLSLSSERHVVKMTEPDVSIRCFPTNPNYCIEPISRLSANYCR